MRHLFIQKNTQLFWFYEFFTMCKNKITILKDKERSACMVRRGEKLTKQESVLSISYEDGKAQ